MKRAIAILAICAAVISCDQAFLQGLFQTVDFDLNYADAVGAPPSQAVLKGGRVSKPASPHRTEYSFIGWYREKICTTDWDFSSDLVAASLTLYAKWTTVAPTPPTFTLTFNLNYAGASGAPPPQSIAQGGLARKPVDPTRGSYIFGGWYREQTPSQSAKAWDFSVETITSSLTLFAKWIDAPPPSPGQVYSLEFGHTSGAKDYCNPVTFPTGFGNGVLYSVWTRIPQTLTPPSSFTKLRGNMEVFYLDGSNWHLICLVGNVDAYPDGYALYNANFMLGTTPSGGKGDYCTYLTLERDKLPLATVNDWVWVAWQVVVNADHTMTLRQWLKYGIGGAVFAAGQWDMVTPPGEETVAIPGWNPGLPSSFRVGTDNTFSGINTGSKSYLTHARMEARSTKPSLPELEAIARLNTPDPTAWGDWELNWKDGAANLADRSGHGRALSIQASGALYQGPLSPVF